MVVPIPKNKNYGNCHKITDFRGINKAISPVTSKVFEHCLLALFSELLSSSVNQFGFKKGKGTRDAIIALSETVNSYINNSSTVNICRYR